MADKTGESSSPKTTHKTAERTDKENWKPKMTNKLSTSSRAVNKKEGSPLSNLDDKTSKNADLKIARELKKFIESYMEREFKAKNVQTMTLQDLGYAVNQTEYGEFLRSFFKIDSRQLAKRLHMFLLTYPDHFVVETEKAIVRFVTPEELGDLKYTVEERTCEFLLFCLSLQANFLIPVKQLRAYLRYSAVDVERYVKENYENLEDYLAIYPTLFYVCDDYVGLTSAKVNMQKRGFDLSRHEQISLEERLVTKVEYVDTVEAGKAVSDFILSSDIDMIAFDSEGTHLGESDGILALVQVAFIEPGVKLKDLEQATIVENLRIYFFDILKCEELVKTCLEPILVQPNIIKILHDARNDLAALSCYFKVNVITKVFDSSKIYFKLTGSNTNGLHTVYEEISGQGGMNLKPRMRQYYVQNDAIWEERPLRSFFLFYAAMDVLSLISIYLWLDKKFDLSKCCPEQIYTNHVVKVRPMVVYGPGCVNVKIASDADEGEKSVNGERNDRGLISYGSVSSGSNGNGSNGNGSNGSGSNGNGSNGNGSNGSGSNGSGSIGSSSNGRKSVNESPKMPNGRIEKPAVRSRVSIDDFDHFKAKIEKLEAIARGEIAEESD